MRLWPCRVASAPLKNFFEAWTWRQLGYHNKPVGLLNLGGYYNDLLKFLQSSVSQGFMQQNHLQLITHHTSVSPLLSTLIESAGFSTAAFSREL